MNRFLYGPAGWSYPDWKGIVYPARARRGFDPLAHLAEVVDLVEINTTFYAPIGRTAAEEWVARTLPFPAFRFVVKAWQRFTHEEHGALKHEEARTWSEGLRPLVDAGRVLAILVQFPWRRRAHPAVFERLRVLRGLLPPLPIAVEFRHASFDTKETLDRLAEEGFAFVNIDQPVIGASLPPTTHVTAPLAYVRLHGRNAAAWFAKDAGRDQRYDYRYTAAEVREWADRVRELRLCSETTLLVGNNHYEGKAMADVLSVAAEVLEERVLVPEPLLDRYPDLQAIAKSPPGALFC